MLQRRIPRKMGFFIHIWFYITRRRSINQTINQSINQSINHDCILIRRENDGKQQQQRMKDNILCLQVTIQANSTVPIPSSETNQCQHIFPHQHPHFGRCENTIIQPTVMIANSAFKLLFLFQISMFECLTRIGWLYVLYIPLFLLVASLLR